MNNVATFFDQALSDPVLGGKLGDAAVYRGRRLLSVAQEAGYPFTAPDFVAAVQGIMGRLGSLFDKIQSDQSLKKRFEELDPVNWDFAGLQHLASAAEVPLSPGELRLALGGIVVQPTYGRTNKIATAQEDAFTLEHYLDVLQPQLPGQLIGGDGMARIRGIAAQLPGPLTSFFGFECRLGSAETKGDFLLSAKPDGAGRGILANTDRCYRLPKNFTHPSWDQVRSFCSEWAKPASDLEQRVQNVWLEFDMDDVLLDAPSTSVFFGTNDAVRSGAKLESLRWVTDTALPRLFGRDLPAELRARLLACFTALPPKAYVFQIGMMLARQRHEVRICIRDITPGQLPGFLQAIAWPGAQNELMPLVKRLAGLVDRIDIDLDIGARVLAKVGMECYIGQQSAAKPKWSRFVDYLVNQGLCIPAKKRGLMAYPGQMRQGTFAKNWPTHLRRISALMGPNVESAIIRALHHIKIVYQPGQPLEAKAYLAVNHQWLNLDVDKWSRQATALPFSNRQTNG